MIAKCMTNDKKLISPKSVDYTVDFGGEQMDIEPGKCYAVYGVKKHKENTWYLVHTETINIYRIWWMSSDAYELIDESVPEGWEAIQDDEDTVTQAYPCLFEDGVEEGIFDYEEWAIEAYMDQVNDDPTFPTPQAIDDLNKTFDRAVKKEKYEEGLRLARENGYEFPEKPMAE